MLGALRVSLASRMPRQNYRAQLRDLDNGNLPFETNPNDGIFIKRAKRHSINYTLTAGSEIDFLRGNAGTTGQALTGNELASAIVGRAGNDTLTGGGGDALIGGGGADTCSFAALSDSTLASGRDTIMDFSSLAGDKIDLHLMDAVTTVAGNQAFNFIGTNAFSATAGELHYAPSGANTLISGDVNGDGAADFSILLAGTHVLSSSDFIL